MSSTESTVLAQFLLRRLKELGCNHIFSVPGDFVLGFLNQILTSEVEYVGTCNELNAAYAADAYARLNGLGAVATTYSVGELSCINAVAGAFAEHVPVVNIVGVPATQFYQNQILLHHTFGDYEAPYKMYQHVTVAQTILRRPEFACQEIDRVLAECLQHKKPVYIGIPADMILANVEAPKSKFKIPDLPISDNATLEEAVFEAASQILHSKQPILIPGLEIDRRNLTHEFDKLLTSSGLPYVTMMLSKGILKEEHPQFIGLYCGDRSRPYVKNFVDDSDCVLIFGEKLTDFNTGGFSAKFDRKKTIEINFNFVRIKCHQYNNVYIHDFLPKLSAFLQPHKRTNLAIKPASESCVHRYKIPFTLKPEEKLSMNLFFDRMAHFLRKPNSIVIAETGSSLFSAVEVLLQHGTKFIGQTFYGSIGYTVGACLGACIAKPNSNIYLFIGDGSVQVTCQDISTMIRYNCKPIIFVINNDGYTIERVIVDKPYNDIQPWNYSELPVIFGGKSGYKCKTMEELETALKIAESNQDVLIIEVFLERWDCNESLRSAGKTMALTNRLLEEAN